MAWELTVDTAYPEAETYSGPAERFVADLKGPPEQITLGLFDDMMAQVVEWFPPGGVDRLMRIRIWRDTAPTWVTLYRVEVIGHGSPIPWPAIAIALGLIIGLALLTWAVSEIGWEGLAKGLQWGTIALIALAVIVALGAAGKALPKRGGT